MSLNKTPGFKYFPLHGIVDGVCTCGRQDCQSPGKHPRISANWREIATDDDSTIEEWKRQYPDSNWGLVTGKDSGITVIDVDAKNDGVDTYRNLTSKLDIPKGTYVVGTGGGGYHIYYGYDPSVPTRSRTLGDGIDTRNDGGYVVAPGSTHISGGKYELKKAVDISELMPFPSPLRTLAESVSSTGPSGDGTFDFEAEIIEGGRNDTITRYAGKLLSAGLSQGDTLALLNAWNKEYCVPPLSQYEVRNSVESISRREHHQQKSIENERQYYAARSIFDESSAALAAGNDNSHCLRNTIEQLNTLLSESLEDHYQQVQSVPDVRQLMDETVESLQAPEDRSGQLTSGFNRLDATINGFRRGNVYAIAADTGHGKSAFSGCLAASFADFGNKVYIISLEMTSHTYMQRIMAARLGIPLGTHKNLSEENLERIEAYSDEVLDTWEMKIEGFNYGLGDDLNGICDRIRAYRPDVCVIDYLQLVSRDNTNKNMNREQEVAHIVRELWKVAGETECVMLLPCQINRTGNPELPPSVNEIRESASIGHYSAGVFYLRPVPGTTDANLWVVKNRYGENNRPIRLLFQGEITKFEEIKE